MTTILYFLALIIIVSFWFYLVKAGREQDCPQITKSAPNLLKKPLIRKIMRFIDRVQARSRARKCIDDLERNFKK